MGLLVIDNCITEITNGKKSKYYVTQTGVQNCKKMQEMTSKYVEMTAEK